MKQYFPKSLFERFALVSILLFGAYARLWRIREYMTFLGDEGRDMLIVRHIFTDFDIPFIGPTSSAGGFFLGPVYYYFMAPFLALFRFDPVGPAIMVALFGIATIYFVRIGCERHIAAIGADRWIVIHPTGLSTPRRHADQCGLTGLAVVEEDVIVVIPVARHQVAGQGFECYVAAIAADSRTTAFP